MYSLECISEKTIFRPRFSFSRNLSTLTKCDYKSSSPLRISSSSVTISSCWNKYKISSSNTLTSVRFNIVIDGHQFNKIFFVFNIDILERSS